MAMSTIKYTYEILEHVLECSIWYQTVFLFLMLTEVLSLKCQMNTKICVLTENLRAQLFCVATLARLSVCLRANQKYC